MSDCFDGSYFHILRLPVLAVSCVHLCSTPIYCTLWSMIVPAACHIIPNWMKHVGTTKGRVGWLLFFFPVEPFHKPLFAGSDMGVVLITSNYPFLFSTVGSDRDIFMAQFDGLWCIVLAGVRIGMHMEGFLISNLPCVDLPLALKHGNG